MRRFGKNFIIRKEKSLTKKANIMHGRFRKDLSTEELMRMCTMSDISIVNPLLKKLMSDVGKPLAEYNMAPINKTLEDLKRKYGVDIKMPIDYLYGNGALPYSVILKPSKPKFTDM